MRLRLPSEVLALRAGDQFGAAVRQALESLPPGTLPLGLTGPNGGAVDDRELAISVREWAPVGAEIRIDIGVFYHEIVAGCSCGDEPMPLIACAALRVWVDAASGEVRFEPLAAD